MKAELVREAGVGYGADDAALRVVGSDAAPSTVDGFAVGGRTAAALQQQRQRCLGTGCVASMAAYDGRRIARRQAGLERVDGCDGLQGAGAVSCSERRPHGGDGQQTADGRRQTADGRRQTADGRQQTADSTTIAGQRSGAASPTSAAGLTAIGLLQCRAVAETWDRDRPQVNNTTGRPRQTSLGARRHGRTAAPGLAGCSARPHHQTPHHHHHHHHQRARGQARRSAGQRSIAAGARPTATAASASPGVVLAGLDT